LPVRRLTAEEYNNTVKDIFGDATNPAGDWSPDVVGDWGFRSARATSVKEVEEIRNAALRVSASATANVEALLGCKAGADDATCVRELLTRLGRRMYRRPLASDELEKLTALHARLRGPEIGFDRKRAVEFVLQAMLQSPSFLYRWDLAPSPRRGAAGLVKLDGHTVAARLSYFLWATTPDQALETAAQSGTLDTPEGVRAQAERLLASPRARGPIVAFVSQWLGLDRVRSSSESLLRALRGETAALVGAALVDGERKLDTLFASSQGFVEEKLAAVYGVPNVRGTEARMVSLDPRRRPGILTRAAFLMATADGATQVPPKRGAAIYAGVLCGDLPPQPNMIPEPEPPNPSVSTRERFEKHAKNPCATACHGLVDPPGFALGNYDGTGKFVETEAGKAIDASGALHLPGGDRIEFRDGPDFLDKLARSAVLRRCATRQLFRNALTRIEDPTEQPQLDRGQATLERAGTDLRALLLEAVTSPAFLHRAPSKGEVLP
jgi:hypothetical protein